jgi:hypothetical protein
MLYVNIRRRRHAGGRHSVVLFLGKFCLLNQLLAYETSRNLQCEGSLRTLKRENKPIGTRAKFYVVFNYFLLFSYFTVGRHCVGSIPEN